MWTKIKSLLSWKTGGLILTAVLMIIAGQKAVRHNRKVKEKEDRIDAMLHSGVKSNLKKASELQRQVKKHKSKASEAATETKERLDKIGETNETIDKVADRWSTKRVHKPAD